MTTEQALQRLAELRVIATGGAQIISRATKPTKPAGTTLRTTIILAVLIGIGLSFMIIFLLESIDRRMNSVEEIEREYELSSLAVIPQRAFKSRRAADREEQLEPYRMLRTALDAVVPTNKLSTLLVTSAISGEGKTTVAVDLAHAIALTGRRVTVVELDLRQPTFGAQFGIDSRHGFTSVVSGREALADALAQPFDELPGLSVLPSGPLPSNPSELLDSTRVSPVLMDVAAPGGIVIVDAPPLNLVADTHVLLRNPAITSVIVVARLRHTKRNDVRRARAILSRNMLAPVGVVVTGMRQSVQSARYGYPRHNMGPVHPGTDEQLGDATVSSRLE